MTEPPKKASKPKAWKYTKDEQALILTFLGVQLLEIEDAIAKARRLAKAGPGLGFEEQLAYWENSASQVRNMIPRVSQKRYHPKRFDLTED